MHDNQPGRSGFSRDGFGGFVWSLAIANEFAPTKYMLVEIDVIGTEQQVGAASAAMVFDGVVYSRAIANKFAPAPE